MKFLDALLGRSRPVRSHLESLMSISTLHSHLLRAMGWRARAVPVSAFARYHQASLRTSSANLPISWM